MATTKKMTELQALAAVKAILETLTPEQITEMAPSIAEDGWIPADLIGKNDHMFETRNKRRVKDPNAPKVKTKTRLANEARMPELVELMRDHPEGVTSDWVMAHVKYITSTQKVTSLMTVAKDMGIIVNKTPANSKEKTLYFLADQ